MFPCNTQKNAKNVWYLESPYQMLALKNRISYKSGKAFFGLTQKMFLNMMINLIVEKLMASKKL